jgi:hypothetical protein
MLVASASATNRRSGLLLAGVKGGAGGQDLCGQREGIDCDR